MLIPVSKRRRRLSFDATLLFLGLTGTQESPDFQKLVCPPGSSEKGPVTGLVRDFDCFQRASLFHELFQ